MNVKLLCYIICILLICIIISIKIDNNNTSKLSITVKENFGGNKSTLVDNRLVDMNDLLTKLELKLSVLKEPVNNTLPINKLDHKKPYVGSVKHYYG